MDISRSRDETAFLLLPVFDAPAPSLAVLEEWSRSRRGGGTSGDVPVSLPSLEITYYLLHSFAMATEGGPAEQRELTPSVLEEGGEV